MLIFLLEMLTIGKRTELVHLGTLVSVRIIPEYITRTIYMEKEFKEKSLEHRWLETNKSILEITV